MTNRTWIWLLLIAVLIAIGVALSWADSILVDRWFGEYLHVHAPRKLSELHRVRLRRIGPAPALGYQAFSFGWFLSLGFGLTLASLAVTAVFPVRIRVAVERLEGAGGPLLATVAGLVMVILVGALAFTLRRNLVLFGLVPLLSLLAVILAAFGLASIGFAAGRRLRRRLGPANVFICALAGILVVYDLILLPVVGWALAAVVLLAALGLAVVTRMGSEPAWNFEELDW